MNAKTYLQQYKKLKYALENKRSMLAELRSAAISIGAVDYSKPAVVKSPNSEAGYAKLIERIEDLETKVYADLKRLYGLKYKMEQEIGLIEDAECYELLYKRYLECKRWELIAVEMNYSFDHVSGALHNRALKLFAKVLSELNKQ